jgi:hypothetical protein
LKPLPRGKIRFGGLYGNAGLIGISASEFRGMSVFQWNAVVDAYAAAHGGDAKPEAPTPEEFYAAVEAFG